MLKLYEGRYFLSLSGGTESVKEGDYVCGKKKQKNLKSVTV